MVSAPSAGLKADAIRSADDALPHPGVSIAGYLSRLLHTIGIAKLPIISLDMSGSPDPSQNPTIARSLVHLPQLRHLTTTFIRNCPSQALGEPPTFRLTSLHPMATSAGSINAFAWYTANSRKSLVELVVESTLDPRTAEWCLVNLRNFKHVEVQVRGRDDGDEDAALGMVQLPELRQLRVRYHDVSSRRYFVLTVAVDTHDRARSAIHVDGSFDLARVEANVRRLLAMRTAQ